MRQWELSRKEKDWKAQDYTLNHRFPVMVKAVIYKFLSSANLSWEPCMCRHPSSSKHCLLVIVWGGVFLMSLPHPWRSLDPCLTNSQYITVAPHAASDSGGLGICFPPWSDAYTCLVIIVSASHLHLNHTCAQALNPRLKLLMHKEGGSLQVWWAAWVLETGKGTWLSGNKV